MTRTPEEKVRRASPACIAGNSLTACSQMQTHACSEPKASREREMETETLHLVDNKMTSRWASARAPGMIGN